MMATVGRLNRCSAGCDMGSRDVVLLSIGSVELCAEPVLEAGPRTLP